MATWDDVRRIALALPESTQSDGRGLASWAVRGRAFAWERPLRPADKRALGDAAPTGDILGVRVPHLVAKEALLAELPEACFTTPHFDGYPALLVRLDTVGEEDLRELIVEAWLVQAPKRLAEGYLSSLA